MSAIEYDPSASIASTEAKRTRMLQLSQRKGTRGSAPTRPRSPSPEILTTEQQEATISRMLQDNAASRRYWQFGFASLCFLIAATCSWFGTEHAASPFSGPASHFAPLESVAPDAAILVCLGTIALASVVVGVSFLMGFPQGCYFALAVGIIPLVQFGAIYVRFPSALTQGYGWTLLWLPLALPFIGGTGLYIESVFTMLGKEISELRNLKYNAHSA